MPERVMLPMIAVKSFEDHYESIKLQRDFKLQYWNQKEKKMLWIFGVTSTLFLTIFLRKDYDSSHSEIDFLILASSSVFIMLVLLMSSFFSNKEILENHVNFSLEQFNLIINKIKTYDRIGADGIYLCPENFENLIGELKREERYYKNVRSSFQKLLYGRRWMNRWRDKVAAQLKLVKSAQLKFGESLKKDTALGITMALDYGLYPQEFGNYDSHRTYIIGNRSIAKLNGLFPKLNFSIYSFLTLIILSHVLITFNFFDK